MGDIETFCEQFVLKDARLHRTEPSTVRPPCKCDLTSASGPSSTWWAGPQSPCSPSSSRPSSTCASPTPVLPRTAARVGLNGKQCWKTKSRFRISANTFVKFVYSRNFRENLMTLFCKTKIIKMFLNSGCSFFAKSKKIMRKLWKVLISFER